MHEPLAVLLAFHIFKIFKSWSVRRHHVSKKMYIEATSYTGTPGHSHSFETFIGPADSERVFLGACTLGKAPLE